VRHGIVILTDLPWREARPRWEAAEALGFDHAWTYDHLVWGGLPEAPWTGAFPALAAAAMATTSIGLGTFVASPNYRHPYVLLRDSVGLADISSDRFLLGLGTGGDGDAQRLGEDLTLRQRVDRFHEYVELLDRLLREDHVDHDGDFYVVRDARTLPGPARDRIPLWIAANGPRSLALAASSGDAWITYGGSGQTLEAWFGHVEGLMGRFREAEAAAGRSGVRAVLSLDSSPQFSLSSVGVFEEMTGPGASRRRTPDPRPAARREGPAGRLRGLRRLGPRRGGRQADLLRPLRAAAPRPGVGRHRDLSDGQRLLVYKDMGLVSQVFDERSLASLRGHLAVGHCRYSTTGGSTWENAQPTFRAAATTAALALATTAT
jgi:alkanesulfonate monooxygenase SsuD/methylene tetrahydromethanopterin reductase-like flavin-dependent oxidoreductase (luciferase family)